MRALLASRQALTRAFVRRSNATAIERHDRAASLLRRGVDAFPKDVRLLTRLGDALWCVVACGARADGSRFSRSFHAVAHAPLSFVPRRAVL